MADNENKELWEQGECSLFKARLDRRKASSAFPFGHSQTQ
jgi:hypothetical protein